MGTRKDFNSLDLITPPISRQDKLKLYFKIKYGSVRKLSQIISVSPTAIRKWIVDPELYPLVNKKIIGEIGFDPNKEER